MRPVRPLIAAINKLQSQMSSCPSSISQAAAAHALASEQTFVGESVKLYRERRDYACARLNAVPPLRCLVPDGAFYLYPSCAGAIGKVTPEGKTIDSDLDFVLYLLDKGGVAVGPWRGLWAFSLFSAFDRDIDGDDQAGVRPHREGLRRCAAVAAQSRREGIASCCDRPSFGTKGRAMSVDFTKLKSFVKIVDAGSVSRAASILRTAQPALSQQVAALESHFKHKLLTRSNTGITPTEAGLVLYRHAQLLLKQIEQAKIDIDNSSKSLAGGSRSALRPIRLRARCHCRS